MFLWSIVAAFVLGVIISGIDTEMRKRRTVNASHSLQTNDSGGGICFYTTNVFKPNNGDGVWVKTEPNSVSGKVVFLTYSKGVNDALDQMIRLEPDSRNIPAAVAAADAVAKRLGVERTK